MNDAKQSKKCLEFVNIQVGAESKCQGCFYAMNNLTTSETMLLHVQFRRHTEKLNEKVENILLYIYGQTF